jgi:hypothetical protein
MTVRVFQPTSTRQRGRLSLAASFISVGVGGEKRSPIRAALLLCARLLRLPFRRDSFARNNWVNLRRRICINWSVGTISRSRTVGIGSSVNTGFGNRYTLGVGSRVDTFNRFRSLNLIECLSRHTRNILWLHGDFPPGVHDLIFIMRWDKNRD